MRWDQRGPPQQEWKPRHSSVWAAPLTGQSDCLFMQNRLKKDNVCALQSASCVSPTGKVVRQTGGERWACWRQKRQTQGGGGGCAGGCRWSPAWHTIHAPRPSGFELQPQAPLLTAADCFIQSLTKALTAGWGCCWSLISYQLISSKTLRPHWPKYLLLTVQVKLKSSRS